MAFLLPPPPLLGVYFADMPWTSLCDLDELTENEGKFVEIDGFKLATGDLVIVEYKVLSLDELAPVS